MTLNVYNYNNVSLMEGRVGGHCPLHAMGEGQVGGHCPLHAMGVVP